eukprot:4365411-Prymnesium_polylepis.1
MRVCGARQATRTRSLDERLASVEEFRPRLERRDEQLCAVGQLLDKWDLGANRLKLPRRGVAQLGAVAVRMEARLLHCAAARRGHDGSAASISRSAVASLRAHVRPTVEVRRVLTTHGGDTAIASRVTSKSASVVLTLRTRSQERANERVYRRVLAAGRQRRDLADRCGSDVVYEEQPVGTDEKRGILV